MSIREGNARDRDGRNSDGWAEEEEKKQRGGEDLHKQSKRKMEWRGIELTLGEGRKKRKIEWVNSR